MNLPMTAPAEQPMANAHLETLRALQRRLLRHIANGRSTDLAAAPLRLPVSIYADPQRLAGEREQLFLQQPLVAGLSGDVPNPGDALLFEGAGRPIVVLRGADGIARAFLNRCTHRGARLVTAQGPHASLSCPFHGWTFNLHGALITQPGRIAFEGLDPDALGLRSLPCAEWRGLIFVSADPDGPAIDVEAHLGPFAPILAELNLDRVAAVRSGTMQAHGNWKYVLETFGEGYHFAALHPDSLGQTHFSNVAVFDAFGSHHRVSFAPKTYKALIGTPETQWPIPDSVVYMIYPNTAMLVGSPMPGHHFVQLFRIYPTAVAQTETLFTLYAPPAQLEGEGGAVAQMGYEVATRIIQTEDFSMAGGAQRNFVLAPPAAEVVIGRNEPALQHLHRQWARDLGVTLSV